MKLLLLILLMFPLIGADAYADQTTTRQAPLTRSQVREAERRLAEMGYWTGPVDGRFDSATRAALIAFQKWEGHPVTGKLTLEELDAIGRSADSKEAWPSARDVGYAHVEVDLDRQVMLLVGFTQRSEGAPVIAIGQGDDLNQSANKRGPQPGSPAGVLESAHSKEMAQSETSVKVLPVSTGTGKPFIEHGEEGVAYTPRGRFVVYEKSYGWENGQLGSVYYANYISGGVAIHGYLSVPNQPASHGCIRIPMFAAREVSKILKLGTIVLVYDEISFVSAKEWVEKPELREAAMLMAKTPDYQYQKEESKDGSRVQVIRKVRPKVIRTD